MSQLGLNEDAMVEALRLQDALVDMVASSKQRSEVVNSDINVQQLIHITRTLTAHLDESLTATSLVARDMQTLYTMGKEFPPAWAQNQMGELEKIRARMQAGAFAMDLTVAAPPSQVTAPSASSTASSGGARGRGRGGGSSQQRKRKRQARAAAQQEQRVEVASSSDEDSDSEEDEDEDEEDDEDEEEDDSDFSTGGRARNKKKKVQNKKKRKYKKRKTHDPEEEEESEEDDPMVSVSKAANHTVKQAAVQQLWKTVNTFLAHPNTTDLRALKPATLTTSDPVLSIPKKEDAYYERWRLLDEAERQAAAAFKAGKKREREQQRIAKELQEAHEAQKQLAERTLKSGGIVLPMETPSHVASHVKEVDNQLKQISLTRTPAVHSLTQRLLNAFCLPPKSAYRGGKLHFSVPTPQRPNAPQHSSSSSFASSSSYGQPNGESSSSSSSTQQPVKLSSSSSSFGVIRGLASEDKVHGASMFSRPWTPTPDMFENPRPTGKTKRANLSFDDRIKMELRSLDLFTTGGSYSADQLSKIYAARQDDEVSCYLRQLQAKLKRQVRATNQVKMDLMPTCDAASRAGEAFHAVIATQNETNTAFTKYRRKFSKGNSEGLKEGAVRQQLDAYNGMQQRFGRREDVTGYFIDYREFSGVPRVLLPNYLDKLPPPNVSPYAYHFKSRIGGQSSAAAAAAAVGSGEGGMMMDTS